MILKLQFIFIIADFTNRATWLALALAFAFLPGIAVPACWAQAQAQAASDSTQPAAAPTADDPPDPPASAGPEAMSPDCKYSRFWLSGKMTFIAQVHPDFHADYSGPHSLSPRYEKAPSRVMTLYTGVRLNNSTELLVDIEEAGGAALTQGFGLAGNTNLDIVRNPSLSKAPYLGRGMIHKVFA